MNFPIFLNKQDIVELDMIKYKFLFIYEMLIDEDSWIMAYEIICEIVINW